MRLIAIVAALVLLVLAPVMAGGWLSDGGQGFNKNQTIVRLSASASEEVGQDRLTASLSVQKSGKTPSDVQREINELMQAAIAKADPVKEVKLTTGGYNVYENYVPEPPVVLEAPDGQTVTRAAQRKEWQGSQSLTLDAIDSAKLLDLMDQLQEMGFAANGMNYYLSREKSESLRDNLTTKAIKTIQTRADAMAQQLGKSKAYIVEVSSDGAPVAPPMPYMARAMKMEMMAADAMPSPVARAGDTTVEITVNATVIIE